MFWRYFFIAAALFNFAAGLPFLLAPNEALALLTVAPAADVLFHQIVGLLVVCFGIGYWLVSLEPQRNRAIVIIGAIGKSGVVVLFGKAWLAGTLPNEAFAISMGDLAFVLGFIAFLLAGRSSD